MTIDERVEQLLPYRDDIAFRDYLKVALQQVARDQRHACAEALVEANPHPMWSVEAQRQAVMNAEIK